MLKFIYAQYVPSSSVSSQYWQNVDLSVQREYIREGTARVSLSAWYNRVSGDAQTDRFFAIALHAYRGSIQSNVEVGWWIDEITTDDSVSTWQLAALDNILLPADTDFIMAEIYAAEDVFNDTSGTEFDGHYADQILLTVKQVPTLIPGDANLDGYVDGADYTMWADRYLRPGTWADGDFTGDHLVDGADYTIWADYYAPAATLPMNSVVPEPSTLALMGIGTISVVIAARRRQSRVASTVSS